MTTKHLIKITLNKTMIASFIIALYIFLFLLMMGCANVDKVQEREGWFPAGMDEDNQSFYNSKYNTMDNGQNDPNLNIRVFGTTY